MPVRGMGMVGVVAAVVMLGGLAMMMSRILMMLRGGAMMFSAFVCRHAGLPLQSWMKTAKSVGSP